MIVQINWNYLVATSLEELNLEQDRLYNQSYRPLYNYRLGGYLSRLRFLMLTITFQTT